MVEKEMMKTLLKNTGSGPLYSRLKEVMVEQLKTMPPASPIPSERELCEKFDVSRPTIRKALDLLELEGHVYRLPGKGTFVADTKEKHIAHELDTFIGFYEDVEMQHKSVSTKVLQQSIVTSSPKISQELGLDASEKIFTLERLRYVNKEPVCLVSSYIPLKICPTLIKYDFTSESLYKTLDNYGLSIFKAQRSIEVKNASNEEALYLGIDLDEPIILFKSVGFLDDGTPFEYVRSRYPAYKVQFQTEVFKSDKTDFL